MASPDPIAPVLASVTHRRVAWALFITAATLAVVGIVGAWNPWRLVVADRWLSHAVMFWFALPFGVYLLHLRWRGHGPQWSDHPRDRSWIRWTWITGVLGAVALVITVGSLRSVPKERILDSSADGRYQLVLDEDNDHLTVRNLDGINSRQSRLQCVRIPVDAAFVGSDTFEVKDELSPDLSPNVVKRYTFDPGSMQILSGC
jgi:hypothetical protein